MSERAKTRRGRQKSDVMTEDAGISGDQGGAAVDQASPWCSNRESEVFRTQSLRARCSQGVEKVGSVSV